MVAAGIVWLMVGSGIIPAGNLWALTHILPYVLMVLGVGLILRAYWPYSGLLVSTIIVLGAVLAIVFAPQLGWAGAPIHGWDIGGDFSGAKAGSGVMETQSRELGEFSSVVIRYPAEVVVKQGTDHSVTITADDNLLPQLSTEIRDGSLYIENSEGDWDLRIRPTKPVEISITLPELKELDFSSAGTLNIEHFQGQDLDINISGAGDVILSELDFTSLNFRLSGAGSVNAGGQVEEIHVQISGFGDFDGSDLKAQTAEVTISGAGQAKLWVLKQLDAEISGAGEIEYYGDPEVNQRINGAGTVIKLGMK
jgi:hypothetical protein